MEKEVNRQSQKAAESDMLRGQLSTLKAQNQSQASQINDLNHQNRNLLKFKEQSGINNSNAENLKNQMRQARLQAQSAENRVKVLEGLNSQLKSKLNDQNGLADQRESERQRHYQELASEAEKMQKKMLDMKEAQIEELNRQVEFFRNQSEGNRGEIDKAKRSLESRLHGLENELLELKGENSRLKDEIARLNEVIDDKDAMLRKIGNMDIKEEDYEIEGLVSEVPGQNEDQQLERVYNQLLDREENGGDYGYMQSEAYPAGNSEHGDEEEYRAKMTLLSRRQKNTGVTSRPNTLMTEVDSGLFPKVNAKMEQSELRDGSYVKDIKDSNELLRSQLAKLASELEELRSENERLKKRARELEDLAGQAENLRSRLTTARNELQDMEDEMEKARRKAGKEKRDLEDKTERLGEKLSREQGKNQGLEQELRRVQGELHGSQGGLKDMLRKLGSNDTSGGINTELLREIIRKVDELHFSCRKSFFWL